MGALIDSISGAGYTGDPEDDGVGDAVGRYYTSGGTSGGTEYTSGLLQSLTALGTGYMARRLDIDLQNRIVGSQPIPRLGSTQNPIPGYGGIVRTPQGQQVAQINMSAVMPLLIVGLVAFFMAKRG